MLISFYFNRHSFLLQPLRQQKDWFFHDFCRFLLKPPEKCHNVIARSEMPQKHSACQRRIQEPTQDSLIDFQQDREKENAAHRPIQNVLRRLIEPPSPRPSADAAPQSEDIIQAAQRHPQQKCLKEQIRLPHPCLSKPACHGHHRNSRFRKLSPSGASSFPV